MGPVDGNIGICQCRILTAGLLSKILSFCNASHVDNDKLDEGFVKWCKEVLDRFAAKRGHPDYSHGYKPRVHEAKYLQSWIERFGTFEVNTTCAYAKCGLQPNGVDLHFYFILEGLGVAIRMDEGTVHSFFANQFSHNTSVCVGQYQDGRVFLKHEDFCIFAWGASGAPPKTGATRSGAPFK
jgi:hypothetical protein